MKNLFLISISMVLLYSCNKEEIDVKCLYYKLIEMKINLYSTGKGYKNKTKKKKCKKK